MTNYEVKESVQDRQNRNAENGVLYATAAFTLAVGLGIGYMMGHRKGYENGQEHQIKVLHNMAGQIRRQIELTPLEDRNPETANGMEEDAANLESAIKLLGGK